MKKQFLSLLLTLSLLAGLTAAASGAGSAEDPLVSLSYAKNWAANVVRTASERAKSDLKSFGSTAVNASKSQTVVYPKAYTLGPGGTMTLGTGCSVVLSSGSAKVNIQKGSLVNATLGAAASSGGLNVGHSYIVCENSSVTVTASSDSVLLACGSVTTTGTKTTFQDVKPSHWFYSAVNRGVELGLIHGITDTAYEPERTLSRAEAITLAAQIHRLNATGNSSIPASGSKWYDTYRTYCIQQGILDPAYGQYSDEQMNAAITRGEFVHIFYHALPESDYSQINAISDGAIPDVTMSDPWAQEIYAFYRAGILGGYTNSPGYAEHAFGASSNIRRNEVAVIVVHMMDTDTRIHFTI